MSKDFCYDLFDPSSVDFEETPLIEWKSDLYNFHEHTRQNSKKVAEFIRDVISLANTAVYYRKPAYLVFGVQENNDGSAIVAGVDEHLQKFKGGFEELKVKIEREYLRYIKPHLITKLKRGNIDGKIVMYLLVEPHAYAIPYQVATRFPQGGNAELEAGQAWIRRGANKRKISLAELTAWKTLTPHIFQRKWKEYFEKIDINNNYIINLYFDNDNEPAWKKLKKLIIERENKVIFIIGKGGFGKTTLFKHMIHEYAVDGMEVMKQKIKKEDFDPPPTPIPVYIPLVSQRYGSVEEFTQRILDKIRSTCELWPANVQEEPELLFKDNNLHWVLFLDGLDEVSLDEDDIKNFIYNILSPFVDRFPSVSVVISSRPISLKPWEREAIRRISNHFHIRPLNERDIIEYIRKFEIEIEEVKELLSDVNLLDCLSYPVNLASFIEGMGVRYPLQEIDIQEINIKTDSQSSTTKEKKYITKVHNSASNIDIPINEDELIYKEDEALQENLENKSGNIEENNNKKEEKNLSLNKELVLDTIYQNLLEREKSKRGDKIRDCWDAIAHIAFEECAKKFFPRQRLREKLEKEEILWVLGLGIMEEAKRSNFYKFMNYYVQSYFAALYLFAQELMDSSVEVCFESLKKEITSILNYLKEVS